MQPCSTRRNLRWSIYKVSFLPLDVCSMCLSCDELATPFDSNETLPKTSQNTTTTTDYDKTHATDIVSSQLSVSQLTSSFVQCFVITGKKFIPSSNAHIYLMNKILALSDYI